MTCFKRRKAATRLFATAGSMAERALNSFPTHIIASNLSFIAPHLPLAGARLPAYFPQTTISRPRPSPSPSRPPTLPTASLSSPPPPPSFPPGIASLQNEGAYAVLSAATALEASTGRAVIHLEIGQPGFETPPAICDAGAAAIAAGKTKYVAAAGIPALRAAIATRTSARAGVDVAPERVVVGPGAKPGLFFVTAALVRGPHDEVVIPDPGFPTYEAMVDVAGGTVRKVRLGEGMRCFDMEKFEDVVSERTRMVVLNSPSNPTGGVAGVEDLKKIAALAEQYDFYVLSDEIYSALVYDEGGAAPSILSLPRMLERTIVVDGFSKTWAMTGWRLGWAVMPEVIADRVALLMTHSVGCTAAFVQEAGLAALGEGLQSEVVKMREEYRKRRDLVVEGLNGIPGVHCAVPDGAFYVMADVSSYGMPAREIAALLLEEGYVAVLPGTDFGDAGEGYLRISYVSDVEDLVEGVARMKAVLCRLESS